MTRPSITLRDVLTAGALITSVAALANSGPVNVGVKEAFARPSGTLKSLRTPAVLESKPAQGRRDARSDRPRDRRFGRVEVREFALVDDAGRERASLSIDGGDVVRFKAASEKASDAFLLSVFPDGRAALLLKDERGRNRATLAIADDGRPFMSLDERGSFCLDDERGRHRLVLRVHDDGEPEVWMDNKTFSPE